MKTEYSLHPHRFIVWLLLAFLAGVVFTIAWFSYQTKVYYNSSDAAAVPYIRERPEIPSKEKADTTRQTECYYFGPGKCVDR